MAVRRKKRATIIEAKPYPGSGGTAFMVRESAGDTVGQALARRVCTAGAYTVGDQTPPAAILWPDGEQRWAGVLPELKALIPELYSLGAIAPEERTGKAGRSALTKLIRLAGQGRRTDFGLRIANWREGRRRRGGTEGNRRRGNGGDGELENRGNRDTETRGRGPCSFSVSR